MGYQVPSYTFWAESPSAKDGGCRLTVGWNSEVMGNAYISVGHVPGDLDEWVMHVSPHELREIARAFIELAERIERHEAHMSEED